MSSIVIKAGLLMTVYAKDCHTLFEKAVTSLLEQDYPHVIALIVVDGDVPEPIELVLKEAFQKGVKILRLKTNSGVSNARNVGIEQLRSLVDYIAIFDADDISRSDRISVQVGHMTNHQLDVCSSSLAVSDLLTDNPNEAESRRFVPSCHDKIRSRAVLACPINNPSVMIKAKVFDTHRYDTGLNVAEDYSLWIDLLLDGYKFGNIIDDLVSYHQPAESLIKRRGMQYFRSDLSVKMKALKLVSMNKALIILPLVVLSCLSRLLPAYFFIKIYKIVQNTKFKINEK